MKKNWTAALQPLLDKYGRRKHPLRALNQYQLVVMVILSARDTDTKINALAPALFQRYSDLRTLATASPEDLYPYVSKITSFVKKSRWLVDIAKRIGDDTRIPQTLEGLTTLPGIGRKSANVIMGESGGLIDGVAVDLHVLRVVPRMGIVKSNDPKKIEERLMKLFPRGSWRALGIGLTFLGREVCRPTDPDCPHCPVSSSCSYFLTEGNRSWISPSADAGVKEPRKTSRRTPSRTKRQ
ncbi:MAG TPA: endonuclease III [Bacteroidota bacterium]|nr:endonuclease III [Bacteroidota bacterium]